ncbi:MULTISPECIES: hypothetical protein [unclassified Streptomyces]|uniref:hypothetical protein n=1 Tax=unclassified Streptomyces TaxID=2593676 RepID=UPI00089026CE|nr:MULTISPECIES: hypothetical protein [unclassified Streptomyces]PBC72305.1 hypothetical protein BX261_7389 [Streptomyces sp. 2321.6]SDR62230.1 hypothetical protein SAMN05216511_7314 [Streptomyces sp. KS_16]SEE51219.1 hypothetical protein SAMN05428940_7363 [Streptomyces sp. 2133.1]SNC77809.1 hypothetical protein SAMN06272741_7225 [Streptomyces sp. 2114.4]
MTQHHAPAWAIDLVIALQQHEDEHPDNGTTCLIDPLNAVPEDARNAAQIIAAYRQQSPPPDLKKQLDEAENQARGWEQKYFELGEKRSEALAAIDRVQNVSTAPEAMDANEPDRGSYLRGYKHGVLAAKSALRSPTEPSATSANHPCTHCTHPKSAHIADPVWCRHCPPDTSYVAAPGWHQYDPVEEQR